MIGREEMHRERERERERQSDADGGEMSSGGEVRAREGGKGSAMICFGQIDNVRTIWNWTNVPRLR